MRSASIGVAALLLFSACALAQESPDQRARFEAGQKRQSDFEHRLFVKAGFPLIGEAAAAGRDLRRVLFSDPYMFLPVPGVEIERFADGHVTLRVFGRGTAVAPVTIAPSAWTELTQHDAAVFALQPYVPWTEYKPGNPLPPPPPICHGWIVRFESSDLRSATGGECLPRGEADAYAVTVARLAVATRLDCEFVPTNPYWSFSQCFTPGQPKAPLH